MNFITSHEHLNSNVQQMNSRTGNLLFYHEVDSASKVWRGTTQHKG